MMNIINLTRCFFISCIILLLVVTPFLSLYAAGFELEQVNVNCDSSVPCQLLKNNFARLKGSYEDYDHFQAVLKEFLMETSYKSFSFNFSDLQNSAYKKIDIKITPKPLVLKVKIYNDQLIDNSGLDEFLQIKSDSFLTEEKIKQDKETLHQRFITMGYRDAEISYSIRSLAKDEVALDWHIKKNEPTILDSFSFHCHSPFILSYLKNAFTSTVGRPLNREEIQKTLKEVKSDLTSQGYFYFDLYLSFMEHKQGVAIVAQCEDEYLVKVSVEDTKNIFSKVNLYSEIRSHLMKVKRNFVDREMVQFLDDKYLALGRKIDVKISRDEIKNSQNEQVDFYHVKINPHDRLHLARVLFRGNVIVDSEELLKMFNNQATDLTKSHYVDEIYYPQFLEYLRIWYTQRGYLSSTFNYTLREESNHDFALVMDINEGVQSSVAEFSIKFVGDPCAECLEVSNDVFKIKKGSIFNPIDFEAALQAYITRLRELGYYDATYIDLDDKTIVQYENSNQEASVKLQLFAGPQYRVGNVFLIGHQKTKDSVILRKLRIDENQVLSTSFLEKINTAIASLALFKSYQVKVLDYVSAGNRRDIAIQLKEKDYGALEIAPGYRTDLGLRLAAKVTYGNILGLNNSASFEVEANRRINKENVKSERKDKITPMIEYEVAGGYNAPDLFKSYWDYNVAISSSRQRLFKFDADVQSLTNSFTHDLSEKFSFSMRHQLEIISQYNALEDADSGNFQIGSITPALTYDARNNEAYPTDGYFLNLSCEFAKPEFLSNKSDKYDIDFYKLIFRNKFYYSFSRDLILAMFLSTGVQENLAGENGAIPSIRVFRLSGIDTVRGYSEEEINKKPDGKDITDTLIQDHAYMTNVKIEPRYLLRDDLVLGLFLDAGRVQTDKYNPTDLRSAVGVSFKYLTPVGTLDFDYGHKLLRKRYSDGSIDSPGRVQISIGFF